MPPPKLVETQLTSQAGTPIRRNYSFFLEVHLLPTRVTSGIVPIPPGPSQCPYTKYLFQNNSYQLLNENKLYSLTSTYNFCAFKNLQFRFQHELEWELG